MSKHLIKIDNPQHCTISVAHAGKDNQYCESGEVVAIDWQPSSGWGLQEAHYTDEDGNVVSIDLSVREFTMPAKNIVIGGTSKRFVLQDWTTNIQTQDKNMLGIDENGNVVFVDIVDGLAYGGIVSSSATLTPDTSCYYICDGAGAYTAFGGVNVYNDEHVQILTHDGTEWQVTDLPWYTYSYMHGKVEDLMDIKDLIPSDADPDTNQLATENYVHDSKAFKGWFDSSSALSTAYPTPVVGDFAYVHDASPATTVSIYRCATAGTWADSGDDVDTSLVQTFASSQPLNEVHVVGDFSGGEDDVASAESVKIINGKVDNLDGHLNGGEFTKEINWSDGYISGDGTINTSSLSKFSQPFLLKRGEVVTVGTKSSNITIIGTTTATSLSVGDSVTKIQGTTSNDFETYTYKATEDIKIVLCVRWSNYTLSFSDENPIESQVEHLNSDAFLNGIITKEYAVTAYKTFDIELPSGAIVVSLGQYSGILYLNFNNEGTSYQLKNSVLPYTVPFNVTHARPDTSGNVLIQLAKISDYVKPGSITEESLASSVVSEINSKITSKVGKNIFNIKDPTYKQGKAMYGNGSEYNNASTNITAYIPVSASTTYTLSGNRVGGNLVVDIHAYNSSKTHLSEISLGSKNVNVISFTTPASTAFIRMTIQTINWLESCKYMLEVGGEKTMTIPYNPSGGYLQEEYGDGCHCFLPKDIYVATGRTIELYYDQIVLHADRYNIKASCSIGIPLERKFQIIGQQSLEGHDYTLTIEIMDDEYNVYRTLTSTIHCVANTISANKVILPIGTSLTNGKPWLPELSTLSDKLSFTGTRIGNNQVRHEGRSGATCEFYNTNNILYTFDDSYCGVGYDSTEFSSETAYSVGDYCWRTVNGKKVVYKFINAHTGAWLDADAINISQTNPFWDLSNGEVSITSYKSSQGITFDAIIVELGANGINDTPMTNPNGALGIKNFVDAIREDEPTIPIVIVNPMFQSSQNGIGRQGNTDGYSAVSEYKYHTDRMRLDLARATEKMLSGYEGVFYCPIPQTHDSKYNFGNTKVQVNPRIDSTDVVYELQPVDSIHPQTPGYMQMADEIFSTLCYIFGQ